MAKAFKFRLDRLLHLRKLVEDARARDLGAAGVRLQGARQERAGAQQKKDDSLKNLVDLFQKGPLDLNRILSADLRLGSARHNIQTAELHVTNQAAALKESRRSYIVASRDRNVLSRLKEKKEKVHLSEIERSEQRLLDEAGARRR